VSVSPPRVLIAGCGDLGMRCAAQLSSAQVFGLRRNIAQLPSNITPIAADLASAAGFAELPRQIDTLIYAPTPAARDAAAYRAIYIDALRRLIGAMPQAAAGLRLLFVSSTAVYGQNAGEWVDENSLCAPSGFNGQILLEAETQAQALVSHCAVVRLSGLYGPGRHWLLRRVRAGTPIAAGEHWTNRIHLDDAAALIAKLTTLTQMPARILGNDDEPAREHEVLDWIAAGLRLPTLARQTGPAAASGKRVSNELARSLGWRPRYANFRDGYAAELQGILAS